MPDHCQSLPQLGQVICIAVQADEQSRGADAPQQLFAMAARADRGEMIVTGAPTAL